jgi:hypothetical protein
MKIYTKGTALAAAAVFALATAAPAMADHYDSGFEESIDGLEIWIDCAELGGIRKALDFVDFASDETSGRDRLGLTGKLDEAHDKYLHADPPKPCDAAKKLDDFNAKVDQLVAAETADKTKISNKEEDRDAIKCLIEGSVAYAAFLRDGEDCSGGDGGGSDKPNPGKGPKK